MANEMAWEESSPGVEEWNADAPPRELTLAEKIAATRADAKADAAAKKAEAEAPSTAPRELTLAEKIAATRAADRAGAAAKKADAQASTAALEGAQEKLSLAEQIALTRAKAGGSGAPPPTTPDEVEDAVAARARRFAAKQEAEAAEAEAEARAEAAEARRARIAETAAAAEEVSRQLAKLGAEAEAGLRKLTLAEQIAITRDKAARQARRARLEAARAPPAEASGRARDAAPREPAAAGSAGGPVAEVPEFIRADVDRAVAAGRVDELHMLMAKVPPALRSSTAYKALRKELMETAEANKRASGRLQNAGPGGRDSCAELRP